MSPALVGCVHHWFSAKVENLQPGMQGAQLSLGTTLSVGRRLTCHRRSAWQRSLGNTGLRAGSKSGRRVRAGLESPGRGLDPGRGRGAGCPQLQRLQDSPGGGRCRWREEAQEERNPCYGLACGGGSQSRGHPQRQGLGHVVSRPVGVLRVPLLCLSSSLAAGGCQEGLGEDTGVLFTQVPTKGPEVGLEGAVVTLGSILSILPHVFTHKNGISY